MDSFVLAGSAKSAVTVELNCEVPRFSAARIGGGVLDESEGRGLLPGIFRFMRNGSETPLQRFCYAVSPLSLRAHRLALPSPDGTPVIVYILCRA